MRRLFEIALVTLLSSLVASLAYAHGEGIGEAPLPNVPSGGGGSVSVDGSQVSDPDFVDTGNVKFQAVGSDVQASVDGDDVPIDGITNMDATTVDGGLEELQNEIGGNTLSLLIRGAEVDALKLLRIPASGDTDSDNCNGETTIVQQNSVCIDLDGAATGDGGRPVLFLPNGANSSTSWRRIHVQGTPLDMGGEAITNASNGVRAGNDAPGTSGADDFCNEPDEKNLLYAHEGVNPTQYYVCDDPSLSTVLRWSPLGRKQYLAGPFGFRSNDWETHLAGTRCLYTDQSEWQSAGELTTCNGGSIGLSRTGHIINPEARGIITGFYFMGVMNVAMSDSSDAFRFCVSTAPDNDGSSFPTNSTVCLDALGSLFDDAEFHRLGWSGAPTAMVADATRLYVRYDDSIEAQTSTFTGSLAFWVVYE